MQVTFKNKFMKIVIADFKTIISKIVLVESAFGDQKRPIQDWILDQRMRIKI